MGLMAFASLWEPIRPAFLDRPHRAVTELLDGWGIRPGIPVFIGNVAPDQKEKALCVFIVGHTPSGSRRVLHRRMDDCEGPGFRAIQDRFNQAIQNIAVTAAFVPGAREPVLRSLSDYYCHSRRVPNDDVAAVSVAWLRVTKSYETGTIES